MFTAEETLSLRISYEEGDTTSQADAEARRASLSLLPAEEWLAVSGLEPEGVTTGSWLQLDTPELAGANLILDNNARVIASGSFGSVRLTLQRNEPMEETADELQSFEFMYVTDQGGFTAPANSLERSEELTAQVGVPVYTIEPDAGLAAEEHTVMGVVVLAGDATFLVEFQTWDGSIEGSAGQIQGILETMSLQELG